MAIDKGNFFIPLPAKCRVRDEASNLKTEDVIMCCLLIEQWWNSDYKERVEVKIFAQLSLRLLWFPHEVIRDLICR